MNVQRTIASRVKKAVDVTASAKKQGIAALFASSVVQAVTDSETAESKELQTKGIETMDADKQAYYVSLALREVQSIVEMANFNLQNALTQGKPSITNMFFESSGASQVEIHLPFEMEARDDYSEVSGAFSLELRKEYADLVTYKVKMPTATNPGVAVDITLTIPSALLSSIGADKYDTRTKVLQKYIEGLIKKSLG